MNFLNKLLFLFISLLFTNLSAQFKMSGTIKDYKNKSILIKTFSGVEDVVLTRVTTDAKSQFVYEPRISILGMISVQLEDNSKFFIFSDNKDISFSAEKDSTEFKVTFSKSDINKEFQNLNKVLTLKSLSEKNYNQILKIYSQNDEFFKNLSSEIQRINNLETPNLDSYPQLKEYQSISSVLVSDDVDLIFNKLIYGSDFLEKSGMMMSLVSRYLSMSVSDIKSKEELEPKLDKEISLLLDKVNLETDRGQHVLTAVLKILNGNRIDSLYNKYLEKANSLTCKINDELKSTLDANNNIKVGKIAPDFSFNNKVPSIKSLYSIKSKSKLLMFWASWCPHCANEMGFVTEFYNDFKKSGGEIVSISADFNEDNYNTALKKYNMNWIKYSDFLRWDSPIFKQYNISSTPTFILLDDKNKIELIASKITEVRNFLDKKSK